MPVHPKKLIGSKWTAVAPVNRETHFLVIGVCSPEDPLSPVEWIDLEAVYTKRVERIQWWALDDPLRWRQGWQ
ncbi:MAG: TIGR02450 family Trp-rich protein [Nitrospira sp.]